MKALTIHQPWAWLILAGRKRVENRGQMIRYRGPLAIHAGGRAGAERQGWLDAIPDLRAAGYPIPDIGELSFGAILGTVDLVDAIRYDPRQEPLPGLLDARDPYDLAGDRFAAGPVCLILRDPKPLARPIPCRGQQGLWEWDER